MAAPPPHELLLGTKFSSTRPGQPHKIETTYIWMGTFIHVDKQIKYQDQHIPAGPTNLLQGPWLLAISL